MPVPPSSGDRIVLLMPGRPTHPEIVEQLLLYVETALQIAREGGHQQVAERLAATHAALLRDGFKSAPEGALF